LVRKPDLSVRETAKEDAALDELPHAELVDRRLQFHLVRHGITVRPSTLSTSNAMMLPTPPVSPSPSRENDSNARDSRSGPGGPLGRGSPFAKGSENVGIYGGFAFAGLLALIFGRGGRRHRKSY